MEALTVKRCLLTSIKQNLEMDFTLPPPPPFPSFSSATESESDTSVASADPADMSADAALATPPKCHPPAALALAHTAEDDSGVEGETALGSPIGCDPTSSVRRLQRSRIRHLRHDAAIGGEPTVAGSALAHATPVRSSTTPPNKRMRSLNLDDGPLTPTSAPRRRPAAAAAGVGAGTPFRGAVLFDSGSAVRSRQSGGRLAAREALRPALQRPKANVNPFTPDNNCNLRRKKQQASAGRRICGSQLHGCTTPESSFDSGTSSFLLEDRSASSAYSPDHSPVSMLPLKEISNPRYHEEFYEQCKLGGGEHGSVYCCVNKLDGCTYAIKKSNAPVEGGPLKRSSIQEVYAYAALGRHAHVVRYYSAWTEDGYMYIQNEYCNGGNLADAIAESRQRSSFPTEAELKTLLRHVALGLQYMHSLQLAHMDVKPANIFIQYNNELMRSPESGFEEDYSSDMDVAEKVTYKLGDMGHVTSFNSTPVDEGDCRYLPPEILLDDYSHLPKADIFALGLTIHQAGGGKELPKNGDAWHAIRRGELEPLGRYSAELNDLIKCMIHPDPSCRPTAASIVNNPVLCPLSSLSRTELCQRLNEEQLKNQVLSRQLREFRQQNRLGSLSSTALHPPCCLYGSSASPLSRPAAFSSSSSRLSRSSRLVGPMYGRSLSLTTLL